MRWTKTADFLLPLLGRSKVFFEEYLENAYLCDLDVDKDIPYSIYTVLKFDGSKTSYFSELESFLVNHKGFQFSYDIYHGKYVVFCNQISPMFKADYDLIMLGRYSKICQTAKDLLLKGRQKPYMRMILDRDSALKIYQENKTGCTIADDAEVWGRFEPYKEYFDKTKLLPNIDSRKKILYTL